ncbi:MAG TPA: glycosyltransferase family 2 protein [Bryobacteraceae bacterium]|nr:glycosyltransferase family 2 protein [Bryobacteraceae bacterium]
MKSLHAPPETGAGLFISILLSTRNRASELRRALESLMIPANLSAEDWEIIIVDNGSSDHTAELCAEFAQRYPRHFRALSEPTPGKSRALNRALSHVRGEILALIDDDVICDPGYLAGLRKTFSDGFADIAQGRTFVDYHCPRPDWFDHSFDQMMLLTDLGEQRLELHRGFWGVNVAMPMQAITKVGGFCLEIGPGAASGLGEDGELAVRLKSSGYRLFYSPHMVLRHQVSGQRLTKRYVLGRSYRIGMSIAYYTERPPVPLWRYTLYVGKTLALRTMKAAGLQLRGRTTQAMACLCEALQQAGFCAQHVRFRRKGRPHLTIPSIPAYASVDNPGSR